MQRTKEKEEGKYGGEGKVGVVLGKGQVREIVERETVNEMKSTWRAQQLERKIKRLVD